MKFNRIIAILFIILYTISSFTLSFASDKSITKTSDDALKIARFHILSEIKQDPDSKWNSSNISLSNPKEVYDIDGNLTGYLINIKSDGEKAGYVHVGNSINEFPILSFSYEGATFDDEQIESAKGSMNVKDYKIIDVEPGRFAIEFEDQNILC